MPIQVDSFSSAAQAAVTNPIAQRQDQVRVDQRKEDDKEKTKTKPASTAAAQSQQSEGRRSNVVSFNDNRGDKSSDAKTTQQRGSIVNISV
jgi:hypothetical protein